MAIGRMVRRPPGADKRRPPRAHPAAVEELAGPPDAANTAGEPDRIPPERSEWWHQKDGAASYTFPPHSFTIIRFE